MEENRTDNGDEARELQENDKEMAEYMAKNPFAEAMKDGMSKFFGDMKTVALGFLASALVLIGCTTIPTVDKMTSKAVMVGKSVAMVVNLTGVDAKTKDAVVRILNNVSSAIPATNETFVALWTPFAVEEVRKCVEAGEFDAGEGELTLCGFNLACKGIDYIFEYRYPVAKQYRELVSAAIDGFVKGFTSTSKGLVLKASAEETDDDYDVEAYEYLKTSMGR